MRIAIVSNIHGNQTPFEAVLAHQRGLSPDLIFHGGDLVASGASPVEIVDQVRDLGWPGVVGNTDEMLFRPESLREFIRQSPQLGSLSAAIEEMAVVTREALGEERLAWLRGLPRNRPMAQWHSCMPASKPPGMHPLRKRAMLSCSRFTRGSVSRSLSMGIFIGLHRGRFEDDHRQPRQGQPAIAERHTFCWITYC